MTVLIQAPDLNPIDMSLVDLKQAVHAGKLTNILQLKEFCIQKRSEMLPIQCKRLMGKYAKHLQEVISFKGGKTRIYG